jgi:hypothetical protein
MGFVRLLLEILNQDSRTVMTLTTPMMILRRQDAETSVPQASAQ